MFIKTLCLTLKKYINIFFKYPLYIKTTNVFCKRLLALFNDKQNEDLNKRNEVLVELNDLSLSHLSIAYLSNYFAKKHQAKIKLYSAFKFNNLFSKYLWSFFFNFSIYYFNIYKSFNAKDYIQFNVNPKISIRSEIEFRKIIKKIKNKKDILDIKIKNVIIGDIIYDSYLRKYALSTIDLNKKNFQIFLHDVIQNFFFWDDYLKKNNVKVILTSHFSYVHSLNARIATSLYGINCYIAHISYIKKISPSNHFKFNKKKFLKFMKSDKNYRKKIIYRTKKYISYIKKTYNFNEKILSSCLNSKKVNILIAAHSFDDAPHNFGKFMFVDCYDWIKEHGDFSQNKNFNWYIKGHPNDRINNLETIKLFCKKYKNFNYVDPNMSFRNIFNKYKINLALTVYGSIGPELALFNIPTISCCKTHFWGEFNFIKNFDNKKKYFTYLSKFKVIKKNINQKDVFNYFSNRLHILNNDWLIKNIDDLYDDFKRFKNSWEVYGYLAKKINKEFHKRAMEKIKIFIDNA